VQSGINIGLQAGIALLLCYITIISLIAMINLIKYKIVDKATSPSSQ